jgi:hypothetical protein
MVSPGLKMVSERSLFNLWHGVQGNGKQNKICISATYGQVAFFEKKNETSD